MQQSVGLHAVPAAEMDVIEVSPEMTSLLGSGVAANVPTPPDPVALIFDFGSADAPPTLRVESSPCVSSLCGQSDGRYRLVFLVTRPAVERLGGQGLIQSGQHRQFHLTSDLRVIAMALREPSVSPESRSTYRLAKSIELLCETIRLHQAGQLAPVAAGRALSLADTRRILAARRMIDDRCHEKLTLDEIARDCGLNRAKLTRGFREMFDCTVFEAMAERRLQQASRLLLTTDLPVSSVGYESGYLNNASFARAFGRYFGRSPSDYRACGLAA